VRKLKIVTSIAIVLVAFLLLKNEILGIDIDAVLHSIKSISVNTLAISVLYAFCSYISLGVMEKNIFVSVGSAITWPRALFGAFIANSIAGSLGLAFVTAGALRLRIYNAFEMAIKPILSVSVIAPPMIMLCGGVIMSISLIFFPNLMAASFSIGTVFVLASGIILLLPAMVLIMFRSGNTLSIGRMKIHLPSRRVRLALVFSGLLDWVFASSSLFVLCGYSISSLPGFIPVFVAGWLLGTVSGSPAGIGVLDATILMFGVSTNSPETVAAGLVLFRLVYFVVPFLFGMSLLIGYELLGTTKYPSKRQ